MIAKADQFPDDNPSELITKSEMTLVRRAVRNDWPLSDDLRRLVVTQMALIVGRAENERERIAAAKVLVAADAVNHRREASDQADEHKRLPNLNLNMNVEVPPTVFKIVDSRKPKEHDRG